MKSLLFIGYDYHRKTGSIDFLLELLKRRFAVSDFRVDLRNPRPFDALGRAAGDYDVLVCCQVIPPREKLNALFTWRHAALFPMFDACPAVYKLEKWYPYRDFQIICFSARLHRSLKAAGFSARYIQFFPPPAETPDWGDTASAFFWARRSAINCPLVERLLQNAAVKNIHVHKASYPGEEFIPPSDRRMNYSYSEWFPQKDGMHKKMEQSAWYVAPRPAEGIGMSFLEAMAMGRCVVAPDSPTMNEYITHGETGFLYILNHPRPIPPHDVRAVQRQTMEYMQEGYRQWKENREMICEWLTSAPKTSRSRIFLRMTRRSSIKPIKVFRTYRRYRNP